MAKLRKLDAWIDLWRTAIEHYGVLLAAEFETPDMPRAGELARRVIACDRRRAAAEARRDAWLRELAATL